MGTAGHAFREGLGLCPNFHDVRLRLAQVLLDAKAPEPAVTELKRILETSPDYLPARLLLGLAHLVRGDRASATAEWRAVLVKQPDHPRALMYLKLAEQGVTSGA